MRELPSDPQGDLASPLATPGPKYLTEILPYVVPFEKSSWCFKAKDFLISNIAVYKNNRTLLSRMEKISCYFTF